MSPSHACGRCEGCRSGREQLCSNMKFLGSASLFPHVQGMFLEYFVMGERQCYPVGGDISLGELAFAEPLAVGLHARQARPDLFGKSVLVTGAGTIGCLTIMAARLAGAAEDHGFRRAGSPARRGAGDRRRRDAARRPRRRQAHRTPQFDVCYEVPATSTRSSPASRRSRRAASIVQAGTLPHEPLPSS